MFRSNKLKYQLYTLQLFFSVLLFVFLILTYFSYQKQYDQDLQRYIQNEIELHKQEVFNSINVAVDKLNKNRELFSLVHQEVQKILLKEPQTDLKTIKELIHKKYLPKYIDLELYLIDSSYRVYKSTFEKDIGLDLSMITEAKEYLDKTTKDKKIYLSEIVSTDALDMQYKLYSYSSVFDTNYLELGFIDNTLTNTAQTLLNSAMTTHTNRILYNVSKDKEQYYYYPMGEKKDVDVKNEYYQSLFTIGLNEPTKDEVIQAIRSKQQNIRLEGTNYIVYIPMFDQEIFKPIGFNNIVMRLEIDASEKIKFMKRSEQIFIGSVIFLFFFLSIMFFVVRKKFTEPVEIIKQSLSDLKKVENTDILGANNELSEIAKEYNLLYEKLHAEIANKTLLSLTDPLTKLQNRQGYLKSIERELEMFQRYHAPFVMIMFDVDDFKNINDTYGHKMGDNVLIDLAKNVSACIRNKVDSLFRVGGEEFVVICPNITINEGVKVAQKIRLCIEQNLKTIQDRTVTISLGVAEVEPGDNEDTLFQRVDTLLYQSKKSGKNRVSSL